MKEVQYTKTHRLNPLPVKRKDQNNRRLFGIRSVLRFTVLPTVIIALAFHGMISFRQQQNLIFSDLSSIWGSINNNNDFWMFEPSGMVNQTDPFLDFSTSPLLGNFTFTPFEHHKGVVIATKLHGPHQLRHLDQSLCLLHHAYNYKPLYDIVVFTTTPIPEMDMNNTKQLIHPSKITFVVDNRGLQEEIQALSPIRRSNFLKACNVTTPENLTWWSDCPGRIAYNWQAEFRSWHIWNHPAISNYKTMMWLDTDAFCTKEWSVDPITIFLQNQLAILFGNFPQGSGRGSDIHDRAISAFNSTVCHLELVNGTFQSDIQTTFQGCSAIPLIHGFFHITNLDFFRSPLVQKFAEHWIGDGFLQRKYDDQGAVTIPTAILAPNRSWDMYAHDIVLNVYHNTNLDGKSWKRSGGFLKYWTEVVQNQFPAAANVCPVTVGN